MNADRPSEFGWRRAVAVYLATLFGINIFLVLGLKIGKWDVTDYFCPYYVLVADAARQGQLVLWSPLVNGGSPVGYEPQVGAASPVLLMFGLLTGGSEWGFRLWWLSIWCLGGLGILALGRHLRSPPWMACAGAIGYAFSAIYMAHAQHTSYLVAMSFFPWVVWRIDAAMRDRSMLSAAQAGAIWGLSALGGYPGLILAGGGFAALWCLGLALFAEQDGRASVVRRATLLVGVWLGFGIAGLAVLSPTYVGFIIESRGYTNRAEAMNRAFAEGPGAMAPAALTTFSSPYLSIWIAKSQNLGR